MPIRNMWALQPGECIVAEQILDELGCEVYFPVRDIGTDLIVAIKNKHVRIQVKESRYYYTKKWRSGHVGHSWHQVQRPKLLSKKANAAFYVFVTYYYDQKDYKARSFQNRFLIIPTKELIRRARTKHAGSKEIYSYCFHFENAKVWDERVIEGANTSLTNYSKFLDAWPLIEQALEDRES